MSDRPLGDVTERPLEEDMLSEMYVEFITETVHEAWESGNEAVLDMLVLAMEHRDVQYTTEEIVAMREHVEALRESGYLDEYPNLQGDARFVHDFLTRWEQVSREHDVIGEPVRFPTLRHPSRCEEPVKSIIEGLSVDGNSVAYEDVEKEAMVLMDEGQFRKTVFALEARGEVMESPDGRLRVETDGGEPR